MKPGDIFQTQFDKRPFKVLIFDKDEVLYDCSCDENQWTFIGNLKRKCHFYRMPKDLFTSKSKIIKEETLNNEELGIIRPDLPLRIGRLEKASWDNINNQLEEIKNEFSSNLIHCNEIVLIPFGPNGGQKKGIKIKSNKPLSEFEIITKASEIQDAVFKRKTNGIGLHRLGVQNKTPSYYIGEYKDLANAL